MKLKKTIFFQRYEEVYKILNVWNQLLGFCTASLTLSNYIFLLFLKVFKSIFFKCILKFYFWKVCFQSNVYFSSVFFKNKLVYFLYSKSAFLRSCKIYFSDIVNNISVILGPTFLGPNLGLRQRLPGNRIFRAGSLNLPWRNFFYILHRELIY